MSGEKWRATELVKMVRQLQPDIIIDNRLGGNMEKREPEIYAGDFEGPEQVLPPRGVFDEDGNRIPWELCLTLNNQWGYYTQKGKSLFAHVVEQPIGQLCLEGMKGKIESARLVRDGSEVFVADFWHGERSYIGEDDTFVNFGRPIQHTFLLPDPIDTVIELRLK
jgi:hypothetical protein